jgi:hypothetical protein
LAKCSEQITEGANRESTALAKPGNTESVFHM